MLLSFSLLVAPSYAWLCQKSNNPFNGTKPAISCVNAGTEAYVKDGNAIAITNQGSIEITDECSVLLYNLVPTRKL